MRNRVVICFTFLISLFSAAQETATKHFQFDANYFYGTILEHEKDLQHLILQHSQGVMLSYSKKTYGIQDWSNRYGAPDHGYSMFYYDFGNETLGRAYGLYAHYGFYFFNRNLLFRVGAGVAFHDNPYDQETNFRNNAHGSSLTGSQFLMLNYKKYNIYKGLGLQAGFSIVHYSNGNIQTPNASTNTWFFGAGINYITDAEEQPKYAEKRPLEKFNDPIRFNVAFRGGVNTSDVIGLGQNFHYAFSAYADKRINAKSTLQAGGDLFFSPTIKDLIEQRAVSLPEENQDPNADSKRGGLFIGHLLTFNKISLLTQVGYYVYYPFDYEGRIYDRIGVQRYFGENENIFAGISVRANAASAESIEFSIGYRL